MREEEAREMRSLSADMPTEVEGGSPAAVRPEEVLDERELRASGLRAEQEGREAGLDLPLAEDERAQLQQMVHPEEGTGGCLPLRLGRHAGVLDVMTRLLF